jgi:hypothetical protein
MQTCRNSLRKDFWMEPNRVFSIQSSAGPRKSWFKCLNPEPGNQKLLNTEHRTLIER